MRPINLIPVEQRRGAARTPGGRTSVGVYALLGGLGAAVVCVLAFVLLSNSINDKTEKLADVQAQAQGEKQVADALRPYGQFADMQKARQAADSHAHDRPLRLGALAAAAVAGDPAQRLFAERRRAPGRPRSRSTAAAGAESFRTSVTRPTCPAFTMTGCTYSQHAVARMMTRMRNLDDVTKVTLSKSERKEDTVGSVGGGPGTVQSDAQAPTGHPGLRRLVARHEVRSAGRVWRRQERGRCRGCRRSRRFGSADRGCTGRRAPC